jgi:hypothetical protein
VADIFRAHGPAYLAEHALPPHVADVLRAVIACRTSALGGHVWRCPSCGEKLPFYNSCLDRHCPTCQFPRQQRWIADRLERLLPVGHFHVVFTLPAGLRSLCMVNAALVLDLLFRAASSALLTLGRQRLGGLLGITAVLHTWGGQMQYHPHLHCIVTGGAYDHEADAWNSADDDYLFPVKVLGALFRGRFLHDLQRARQRGALVFSGGCANLADERAWARWRDALYKTSWVVYAKQPFRDTPCLVKYLGAYTHRVAISNSRLIEVNDQLVTIRDKKGKLVRLAPAEFIRRFLLHVLPPGFTKIRHTGLYAPTNVRRRLPRARALLAPRRHLPEVIETLAAAFIEPVGRPCPFCKTGRLVRDAEIPADHGKIGARGRRRCRGPPSALPPGFDV